MSMTWLWCGDADTHRDVVDKSSTVTRELLRDITIDPDRDRDRDRHSRTPK